MQPVTSDADASAACAHFVANLRPSTPGNGLTVQVSVRPTLKDIAGIGSEGAWASNSSVFQRSTSTVLIDGPIFANYRTDAQVGVLAHELGHAYSHNQGALQPATSVHS